jgi:ribosomal protein L7/L12
MNARGIKSVQAQDEDHFGLQMSSGAAHALYSIASRLGKIEAIAMVRWKTGMGLVESKNWLEQFMRDFKKLQPSRPPAKQL